MDDHKLQNFFYFFGDPNNIFGDPLLGPNPVFGHHLPRVVDPKHWFWDWKGCIFVSLFPYIRAFQFDLNVTFKWKTKECVVTLCITIWTDSICLVIKSSDLKHNPTGVI